MKYFIEWTTDRINVDAFDNGSAGYAYYKLYTFDRSGLSATNIAPL